eukprot:353978-Prorocentrum_minimum.AAC.2
MTDQYGDRQRPSKLGLDADITPLLSHSAAGEFDSPPKYLRIPRVRVEPLSKRSLPISIYGGNNTNPADLDGTDGSHGRCSLSAASEPH